MRNPEGDLDWLGKKRRGVGTWGRFLTSREMYIYFKDCSVVKSHKSGGNRKALLICRVFWDLEEKDAKRFRLNFTNI